MAKYWIFVVAMSSSSSLGLKMESRDMRSWHLLRLVVVVVRREMYSEERGSNVSRVSRDCFEVLKRLDSDMSDSDSVIMGVAVGDWSDIWLCFRE